MPELKQYQVDKAVGNITDSHTHFREMLMILNQKLYSRYKMGLYEGDVPTRWQIMNYDNDDWSGTFSQCFERVLDLLIEGAKDE